MKYRTGKGGRIDDHYLGSLEKGLRFTEGVGDSGASTKDLPSEVSSGVTGRPGDLHDVTCLAGIDDLRIGVQLDDVWRVGALELELGI